MTQTSNTIRQSHQSVGKYKILNTKMLLLSAVIVCGLPACNTLPKQQVVHPVYTKDTDTTQTALSKIVSPLKIANPDLTGFHVLYNPFD